MFLTKVSIGGFPLIGGKESCLNITPPYVFNSVHWDLSCNKCKKKICHHKLLANFPIKAPHCNGKVGGGETMYNQIIFTFSKDYHGNIILMQLTSFVNQRNEKIRNWSLLMKIVSTVPKLFFKTTDLYTVYLFSE